MIRVKIFVEGQTEETFVRDTLAPYFAQQGIYLNAILAQTSRGHKGGIVSYGKVKNQITKLCQQDKKAWVTTLIDYYGLPTDFPKVGQGKPVNGDIYSWVSDLENAFDADIAQPNFIPNFLVHEFEALLFCEPEKFADWLEDKRAIEQLNSIKLAFDSPESINNSPQSAPSKRILAAIPEYQKTLHGPLIAADIGLDTIRQQCPHFEDWLQRLEALKPSQS
ncbi:DUF4276 family protein [Pectobacterium carotovorum]|uniref:DUF4276 family protein n=1 Tax=Pectobacterium carotovorum TaxID=554 RepID=UPI0001A445CE|nr:DUF4276 family protein [Pectobacterium carotovorum]MBL0864997.1 DUF4276 family protein [Pectobacterium carotovorum]MDK9421280.1 DUF4276 family protein [Pectobacterium carotovorum]QHP56428.1 DUF4276 family protein [Pectobacterium carotovorum subsp. carotovorum]QLL95567.1 DUF4276 family protein [Pectobacterium carotovorum]GKW07314.1 hypothetical protein PEC301889_17970 [Pectobacterium carotovorum subsp. carotovorum]